MVMNAVGKFSWNNHKEMNQLQLAKEFYALVMADKLAVYRFLLPKRRLLLRKAWEKHLKQREQYDFRERVRKVIRILPSLYTDNIHNEKELDLLIQLILLARPDRREPSQSPEKDIFIKMPNGDMVKMEGKYKERDSFDATKKKMLSHLAKMCYRYTGGFGESPCDLYEQLKLLEYIESTSYKKADISHFERLGVCRAHSLKTA
jgi:hypothetical protein